MTRNAIMMLLTVLCLCLVSGCRTMSVPDADTCDGLVDALSEKGYAVSVMQPEIGDEDDSYFSVQAARYDVDNEMVAIYEFDSHETAKAQSERISREGCRIGNAFISWIDTPHFYFHGKIIVQYIGSRKSLIHDLRGILGDEIAGILP